MVEERTTRGHFGLLMLDGLVARHVLFGQIGSTEFLGPGDILRPWVTPDQDLQALEVRWEVLSPARIAVLDRDFAYRVRPWPEIASALLDRGAERANSQVLQSALRQAKRVEDRVLLALWHFAGRWGQIGAEGRIVRLPHMTGAILANIVGARRQSVSTALGVLTARGAIERRADGGWLLPRPPTQFEDIQAGVRASDRQPEPLHAAP